MEEKNMTLGEKLKSARKCAGLTQEQLADKLLVSRQAVAKWESDKGMPDIDNLRRLSKLLGVSIDYLLENGEQIDLSVMREAIDLDAHPYHTKKQGGKWTKKTCHRWLKKTCKKDMIVREKFPNAEIQALLADQKLTRGEKVMDFLIGGLFLAPFGIPGIINSIKNADKTFYLVNDAEEQYFVTVTDEFIEIRKLAEKITEKKFEIGNFKFLFAKILIP